MAKTATKNTTDGWTKCILVSFLVVALFFALYVAYEKMHKKEGFAGDKVKVCLFYATWCGHCEKYLDSKVFDATYSQVKSKDSQIVFEKIDYDQNKNLASKYDVNSFPTIVAIDGNGKKIDTFKGDRYNKEALEQFALRAAKAN